MPKPVYSFYFISVFSRKGLVIHDTNMTLLIVLLVGGVQEKSNTRY